MSYTKHNFTSGMKLSAVAMQDIDNALYEHDGTIALHTAALANLNNTILAAIRDLELDVDSDTIYLMYNGEEISSATIPLDPSGVIPCTGLSASFDSSDFMVGTTRSILYSRQPNDCNQNVRFKSLDPTVASVSSAGVVTAVSTGETTIQVMCGSYTELISVATSREVTLEDRFGHVSWLSYFDSSYGKSHVLQMLTESNLTWNGFIPFDLVAYKIAPGEQMTIAMTPSGNINMIKVSRLAVITPRTGETIEIVDDREDNDRYQICNVDLVGSIDESSYEGTYTHANNTLKDQYLLGLFRTDSDANNAALAADPDTYISVVIGPIPASSSSSSSSSSS